MLGGASVGRGAPRVLMEAESRRLASVPGRLDTLIYSLHRGLQRVSRRLSLMSYRLVAQPVTHEPRVPSGRGGAIIVRQAVAGDPLLAQIDRPRKELDRRFESPGVCFVAQREQRLIGYLWILFGSYQEPEDRCVMVPAPSGQAAWDLDVYVDPAQRLSPTFVRLWDAAHAYLRERGVQWTLSRISAFNARSMASHARLGSIELGRLCFLRLFGLQIFLGSVRPYLAFSRASSSGPRIVACVPPSAARGV